MVEIKDYKPMNDAADTARTIPSASAFPCSPNLFKAREVIDVVCTHFALSTSSVSGNGNNKYPLANPQLHP